MELIEVSQHLPFETDNVEDNIDWLYSKISTEHDTLEDLHCVYKQNSKIFALQIGEVVYCSRSYFDYLLDQVSLKKAIQFSNAEEAFKGIDLK